MKVAFYQDRKIMCLLNVRVINNKVMQLFYLEYFKASFSVFFIEKELNIFLRFTTSSISSVGEFKKMSLIFPIINACLNFIFSFAGYQYLITRKPSNFFYIRSEKSSSHAHLLGGLPLALNVIAVLFINVSDQQAMTALLPALIITGYGFYDDKYEMRARLKLIFQASAVGIFAFSVAPVISVVNPLITIGIVGFFGMALVNGTNLLDGLDTMTLKTAGTSLIGFVIVSYISNNSFGLTLSLSTLMSLAAFYYFNKEPARLYLGEIGGSFIGLVTLMLGVSNFISLSKSHSPIGSFAYVLILTSLPLNELGISFLRRIWAKKSPFRGDRLHLHYILGSKYKLSASKTATSIAAGNLLILAISLPIAEKISPSLGLIVNIILSVGTYIYLCKDAWIESKSKDENRNPFRHLINKPVVLINSKDLEDSRVIICYENFEQKKKAA